MQRATKRKVWIPKDKNKRMNITKKRTIETLPGRWDENLSHIRVDKLTRQKEMNLVKSRNQTLNPPDSKWVRSGTKVTCKIATMTLKVRSSSWRNKLSKVRIFFYPNLNWNISISLELEKFRRILWNKQITYNCKRMIIHRLQALKEALVWAGKEANHSKRQ